MKMNFTAALMVALFCQSVFAQSTNSESVCDNSACDQRDAISDKSACDKLVDLYIELGERSGETVSEAQARTEVMSENPTEAECAAAVTLFEAYK